MHIVFKFRHKSLFVQCLCILYLMILDLNHFCLSCYNIIIEKLATSKHNTYTLKKCKTRYVYNFQESSNKIYFRFECLKIQKHLDGIKIRLFEKDGLPMFLRQSPRPSFFQLRNRYRGQFSINYSYKSSRKKVG